MNIIHFRARIRKAVGKLWEEDSVFIGQTPQGQAMIVTADRDGTLNKDNSYSVAKYEIEEIAAKLKDYFKTREYDMRKFCELYDPKNVPKRWQGIWACEHDGLYYSGQKDVMSFLYTARNDGASGCGLRHVSKPEDGNFKVWVNDL